MNVFGYVPGGYAGDLVSVEVDIRRGIPATDIVGLPDNAVREARERVRVALRKTGLDYPRDHVLINLAPAGVRKSGASFDLAIAVAVLVESGQLGAAGAAILPQSVLVLGELQLDGRVRRVRGVLPAVAAALEQGIEHALVPAENRLEAEALGRGHIDGVAHLAEAVGTVARGFSADARGAGRAAPAGRGAATRQAGGMHPGTATLDDAPDLDDLRGQDRFKRALEIAAAGRHHLMVVGPPGSGKTMGVRALPSVLPDLRREESLEVMRIYSRAGLLGPRAGFIGRPPFRAPHHTASMQGVIGGGRDILPGEISLAHHGVLFLDEAAEFRRNVLQSLREPTEQRRVFIARAGRTYWYPADFQLVAAANPCPCGYFGHPTRICSCTMAEVTRYWKRLGGPLMDRIDLRVRAVPGGNDVGAERPAAGSSEPGAGASPAAVVRERIRGAVQRQRERYRDTDYGCNARVPAGRIHDHVRLDSATAEVLSRATARLSLSARAVVSILRTARTIADLDDSQAVTRVHVLEAVQHRRLGEGNRWL